MATEENKALVQRIYAEGTIEGTLALVDELFDADFVYYGTGGIELHGVEKLKKVFRASFAAFPDMLIHIGRDPD